MHYALCIIYYECAKVIKNFENNCVSAFFFDMSEKSCNFALYNDNGLKTK